MALQLPVETVALHDPDCVYRLPYPRHVPGEEWEAGTWQHDHDVDVMQAEKKALKLRRQSTQHGYGIAKTRNTDRRTRLLIVILVLFLLSEFPLVSLSTFWARPSISTAGNS